MGGTGQPFMTTANWLTVILTLIGLLAQLGWYMWLRFARNQDDMKEALTGKDGAVARIHHRIDQLGETYQTRRETEMQFEHLRAFMDQWRIESQRRHDENLSRFEDIKDQQKAESDSVRQDVRLLRQHLDAVAHNKQG